MYICGSGQDKSGRNGEYDKIGRNRDRDNKPDINQNVDKVDKIDRDYKPDTEVYKANSKLNSSTSFSILSQ